ncbi:unnamed protein product [Rotaria sp. Silwood2]|nr:unnamed protein product [Rotaria sp. Silwood2]CAF2864094.1 unnamed protein product [Rotaria sp. Silwood2]CAF3226184.1 unnamed protein product [Rotaria sp. Silwood2]CAF3944014.1 unnamed protein product [Rotaria sp. Silwood2]CAF4038462.1 unnamed protein product [Rotaria sp. Silwood2]
MKQIDKEKTAFITQYGLWEFNVLPQGIMNGPPTLQRTMNNRHAYGRWDYVMVYLHDILIFSRSFDEHKKHLNEILSILAKVNFQVNPNKCSIAIQEIDFLSHTISEQCIKPNGDKIKAIIDLPAPKTLKEANEFLGKINWYRKFIPDFARIVAPLHKHWSEEVPKPQRTKFIQPYISKNTCIQNADINGEINVVTTRAQSKHQAQPRSSSVHTSSTSTTSQSTCSSPSTANQLYDFSLSCIRSEQAHNITIQQIIQQIRNNRHY